MPRTKFSGSYQKECILLKFCWRTRNWNDSIFLAIFSGIFWWKIIIFISGQITRFRSVQMNLMIFKSIKFLSGQKPRQSVFWTVEIRAAAAYFSAILWCNKSYFCIFNPLKFSKNTDSLFIFYINNFIRTFLPRTKFPGS